VRKEDARREEKRKPMEREVAGARSRKLAAMSTLISLPLSLSLSLSLFSLFLSLPPPPPVNATAYMHHHEISFVALFKLACERTEKGRNEERINERCNERKKKK